MQESKNERYLKKKIEMIGGKALKFISPGCSGVPDRIVLLPEGKIIFVELKAPGEELRPLQVFRVSQLRALGFRVEVLDSKQVIDNFMESIL